jgi:hypothetical protein
MAASPRKDTALRNRARAAVRNVFWLVPHQAARLALRADGVGERRSRPLKRQSLVACASAEADWRLTIAGAS